MIRMSRIAGVLLLMGVAATLLSTGCNKRFPTTPIGPTPATHTPTPAPTSLSAPAGGTQTPGISETDTPTITPTPLIATSCGFTPVNVRPAAATYAQAVIQNEADWLAYTGCASITDCPPPVDLTQYTFFAYSMDVSSMCACGVIGVQFDEVCAGPDKVVVTTSARHSVCPPRDPCAPIQPMNCLMVYMQYAAGAAIPKTDLPVEWQGGGYGVPVSWTPVATWDETLVFNPTMVPFPNCWTPTPTLTPAATPAPTTEVPVQCLDAFDSTIALPGAIGDPGYTPLTTDTPTPTPIPWTNQGVIASDVDWAAYCAMVSIDPATHPAPADFSTHRIIFWGNDSYACPINYTLDSLCEYADRWEVTTSVHGGSCLACPQWYVPSVISFRGFVVLKSDLPVQWKLVNQMVECPGFPATPVR